MPTDQPTNTEGAVVFDDDTFRSDTTSGVIRRLLGSLTPEGPLDYGVFPDVRDFEI